MRQSAPSTLDTRATSTTVKCCLCHEPVTTSGYCENCQTWPINVTPRRFDELNHLVEPDGFCRVCLDYVMTRLEPIMGEWRDTRRVSKLLSREENKARWGQLWKDLEARQTSGQRRHRNIEQEKRELMELQGKDDHDGVPF